MLAPDQRKLFMDALRPPEGYRFDFGIGTTFSMDLLTLIVAPLSLAWDNIPDTPSVRDDPLILLEGLQRCAKHLTVFCQAGRIMVPEKDSYLYRFLEPMVVEVTAPGKGVFHPKVWVLRYRTEGKDEAPFYRVLNLSRNLTFDRSWDLMVRLEGKANLERQRAYGASNPLGDFIRALPGLAAHPVDQRIQKQIEILQHEVRRVNFVPPEPFEQLTFYPMGIPGYTRGLRLKHDYVRSMVISPFLSNGLLQEITQTGEKHLLISRVDSTADLKEETLSQFETIYIMETPEPPEITAAEQEDVGEELQGAVHDPTGLHAKLLIFEHGWYARWLIGSANATHNAFKGRNVEFMMTLEGKRSQVGIDEILGNENDTRSLQALLQRYTPSQAPADSNKQRQQAEKLAEDVRAWLLTLDLRLKVVRRDREHFDLQLTCKRSNKNAIPAGTYSLVCWPLSLDKGNQLAFPTTLSSQLLTFPGLSLLALTPFTAFEVTASIDRQRYTLRFVLKLPITGMPKERDDQIISEIIRDQQQFLHFLWLILMSDKNGMTAEIAQLDRTDEKLQRHWHPGGETPLLEALVRALSQDPEKIQHIATTVKNLQKTEEGKTRFPEGFLSLWDAIEQANKERP